MSRMMTYSDAAALLKEHDNFSIITHINPDGDTLGSACALCSVLRRMGKNAVLYPNSGVMKKFKPYVSGYMADEIPSADFVISVDTATEFRMSDGYNGHVDFEIDHHPTNSLYADNCIVEPTFAATAQAVMKLIDELTGDYTPGEATLLYLGLSTDTGCFRYNNTDADAYLAAAKLKNAGADTLTVNTNIFGKVTPSRMKLEGMIYSSATLHFDGLVTVAIVSREMLAESGATNDDLDDLSNVANRIEGSMMAVTIKQQDDGCRVSLRSAPGYSSVKVCSAFGGGGHEAASGCTIKASPEEAKRMLLERIKEVLDERNSAD